MAEGGGHGQVAQADLRAAVVVVAGRHPSAAVPVALAAVIPALKVLRHQGLVYVLGQQLVPGPLSAPRRSHGGVGVLREAIGPVAAVLPEPVVSVVAVHLVGRVDVVVALHFALVHVSSVVVRLHVWTRVAAHVVAAGRVVRRRLARVSAARVVLDQVRHAPRVAENLHLPVKALHGGGARVQRAVVGVRRTAVIQAGLAGVGRAVLQHLGAAAAVGRRQGEDGLLWVAVLVEAWLRLQAAAAVPEAVGGAL